MSGILNRLLGARRIGADLKPVSSQRSLPDMQNRSILLYPKNSAEAIISASHPATPRMSA